MQGFCRWYKLHQSGSSQPRNANERSGSPREGPCKKAIGAYRVHVSAVVKKYNQRMSSLPEQDPRVYFAAERTFLAWIRTGLGLMGVGFAVARFGLFLREMRASQGHQTLHGTGLSVWSGVAIVALGVVVLVSSILQHVTLIRELSSGAWTPGRLSRNAVLLAALLAVIGIGMALYLVVIR